MNTTTALLLLLSMAFGCHSNGDAANGSAKTGAAGADSKSEGADTSSSGKDTAVPSDTVRIAHADQGKAGIVVAPVIVRSLPQVLQVPGQVAMDERLTHHIGALADGRIERVNVLPGDSVRRGQVLATLHSHSVHETVAALAQAYAAETRAQSGVRYATQKRDRYTKLYAIQAASLEEKQTADQELAQAQKDLTDAQASVIAEREHLAELLQVSSQSLTPTTIYNREMVPVRAAADGVVITRNVTPGQVVHTGDELFSTSDLGTVWVNASVNEADVPRIHRGAKATVQLQSSGASSMPGSVTQLGDLLDATTRTLPVRLTIVNRGVRLRPNMFVTASIAEPATRRAVFVSSQALQDVNGFRVVFVTADGQTFQARAVKPGTAAQGLVEVLEGLSPEDRVVVSGAFMVKGELLKGTVGEG